jgi:hypothetical protein
MESKFSIGVAILIIAVALVLVDGSAVEDEYYHINEILIPELIEVELITEEDVEDFEAEEVVTEFEEMGEETQEMLLELSLGNLVDLDEESKELILFYYFDLISTDLEITEEEIEAVEEFALQIDYELTEELIDEWLYGEEEE